MRISISAAFALILIFAVAPIGAEDGSDRAGWPTWRGPEATGVAPEADPPLEWSEDRNVEWKVEIPGLGTSTPIVWGDRIYLTTAIDTGRPGDRRASTEPASDSGRRPRATAPSNVFDFVVLALDLDDGSVVWQKTARSAQPHEGTHPDGTHASPSPVTDGEWLFAFFGSHGLYAYDLDGKLQWERDFGDMTTRLGFGEGASPALHGDVLVVNWDHEGESFVVAIDKKSGEELWRRDRDEATSWTTPLIVEVDGRAQAIISATNRVRSYDLGEGDLVWEVGGMTVNAIPSPVYADGTLYVTSGFRGSALLAIDLAAAKGDITGGDAVLWSLDQDTPYVPSPLLYRGHLYFLKSNNGLLTVVDAGTGAVAYGPERLASVRNIYASPVGAADRVYLLGREGQGLVIAAGDEYRVLADNSLDDNFDASPVMVGDRLLLRGRKALYCLREVDG